MPAGQLVAPSQSEEAFVLHALQSSALRVDGRRLAQSRPLNIRFGEQLGWCEVSLGKTIAIASVDASIVPPRDDRPYEGIININTDVTPMAGMEYDAGGVAGATESREREALFDRMMERALRYTEAVDREALCIVAGKKVWCINLTMHLLSDEGAAIDAAVLASMVALRHFRRPDVTIADGEVIVHSTEDRVPVPLAYHHMPLSVTFAVFLLRPVNEKDRSMLLSQSRSIDSQVVMENDDGVSEIPVAVLDPSLLEQSLAHTSMTFILNAQREVCVLDKAGGAPLPYQTILTLLNDAAKHISHLVDIVEKSLARDASTRVLSVV
ncbi:3'-5'-exoribonuclease [Malassezia psittaci]|uniref:3'-5'-exoribonuclease n=1 Tax=Malassezia psittaci TaxID=1821823 RepID=A0AAF0F9J9_9BASI|nr:3'-5'-exoribonuclease [Malassezia psittaci]